MTYQHKDQHLNMDNQGRQGDVFISFVGNDCPVSSLEPVDREQGKIVLAHGEHTGHSHCVVAEKEKDAEYFYDMENNRFFLQVNRPVEIKHLKHGKNWTGEHHTLKVTKPGWYQVAHQQEVVRGELRRVID